MWQVVVLQDQLCSRHYQHGSGNQDQPGQPPDEMGDDRAADQQQRNAQQQSDNQQHRITLRQRANSHDVIQAGRQIGQENGEHRGEQLMLLQHACQPALLEELTCVIRIGARFRFAVFREQASSDKQQHNAAYCLHISNLEQQCDGVGETDADQDSAASAYNEGQPARARLDGSSDGADDQRIVAAQHKVDKNNSSQYTNPIGHYPSLILGAHKMLKRLLVE